MEQISWSDFEKIELRIGTVVKAEAFAEARIPAYKLWVDLGPKIGLKKTSAQITKLYSLEDLIGRQVICVTNFPAKQVGPFMSECLVTGFALENADVVLAGAEKPVPNGTRLA